MSQPEDLTPLVSIVVGFGGTDLVPGLWERMRPGRPVRWHRLPLT